MRRWNGQMKNLVFFSVFFIIICCCLVSFTFRIFVWLLRALTLLGLVLLTGRRWQRQKHNKNKITDKFCCAIKMVFNVLQTWNWPFLRCFACDDGIQWISFIVPMEPLTAVKDEKKKYKKQRFLLIKKSIWIAYK